MAKIQMSTWSGTGGFYYKNMDQKLKNTHSQSLK